MKCLVLAGGRGEKLWPLSRKNYPKQFIQIQKNHSLFQDTIARNMPYCDEFIIVTNYEYRYIIESQMEAFQGLDYRCVFEKDPKGTGPAIVLTCMDLQPSEFVLIVPSDHLIEVGSSYQNAIIEGKHLACKGRIVLFGVPSDTTDKQYGWIEYNGNEVTNFIENPRISKTEEQDYLQNSGMMLFGNDTFTKELMNSKIYKILKEVNQKKTTKDGNIIYCSEVVSKLSQISIEKIVCSSDDLSVVVTDFNWRDVGQFEDLTVAGYSGKGIVVKEKSDSTVINECSDRAVVLNSVDDLLVIGTSDVMYIGKKGAPTKLKYLLNNYEELRPYSNKSTIYYRSWGYYEQLCQKEYYRVRRVVLYSGKTIYCHQHEHKNENWTIVQGNVNITLNGEKKEVEVGFNIDFSRATIHQISNIGNDEVIFIQMVYGDIICDNINNISGNMLGVQGSRFVKLLPSYKDNLWGGVKLRDIFRKNCDFDVIAESWELSAHHAGQSVIANGKYKGMLFGQYIKIVGKEILGWKCQSMTEFPLLIKFIDAKENLSVQVHPDDDYALENEHEYGKNEMWYVLDCEPNSSIYVGFNCAVDRMEVERRVKNNTILEILNKVKTHPGDVFFIPAGTVHAIGAGNLIYEIQQNSNSTYRLYDYDRKDKCGNSRELHLEKALDVLRYEKYAPQNFEKENTGLGITLAKCKYFETTIYDVTEQIEILVDDSRFLSIICIEGQGILEMENTKSVLQIGESVFVEACNGKLIATGRLKIIVSHI